MSERRVIRRLFSAGRDEEAVLEGIREGKDGAFNALYQLYAGRAYRLALLFLRDDGLAQHALQETFIKVFRKIHTFRGDSGLGTWIYRIAVNTCLNEMKKTRKGGPAHASGEELENIEDESPSARVEESVYRCEMMKELQGMLESLDPGKRLTFLLHYVDGLTAGEIAEIMNEGRGTILKRLQRTREELRSMAARSGLGSFHGTESGRKGTAT